MNFAFTTEEKSRLMYFKQMKLFPPVNLRRIYSEETNQCIISTNENTQIFPTVEQLFLILGSRFVKEHMMVLSRMHDDHTG